jgi:hypothetical protein
MVVGQLFKGRGTDLLLTFSFVKNFYQKNKAALIAGASALGALVMGVAAHADTPYTPVADTATITAATHSGQDLMATITGFAVAYWPFIMIGVGVFIVFAIALRLIRRHVK